jgi:hypothetical protein
VNESEWRPEITAVFSVEVERRLQAASDVGRIQHAVLRDLEEQFYEETVEEILSVFDELFGERIRNAPKEF